MDKADYLVLIGIGALVGIGLCTFLYIVTRQSQSVTATKCIEVPQSIR